LNWADNHFRSEIAGLRAIAVTSVVLFRLEVGGFQGGAAEVLRKFIKN
jgi:peptidoglycan/LPS O-acetylase OafA/YrhL